MAVDATAGKLYWADRFTDKIMRSDLDGLNLEELIDMRSFYPNSYVPSLSINPRAGKIYFSDTLSKSVYRANLDGTGVVPIVADGITSVSGVSLVYPSITVTPNTGLVTSESGDIATFQVGLTTPPKSDVTIPVSSSDPLEGEVITSSIVFTPANWSVPQTITVTGVDDSVVEGNTPYTVVLGPASSTDPDYAGIDPPDVSITNLDNDFTFYHEVAETNVAGSITSGSFLQTTSSDNAYEAITEEGFAGSRSRLEHRWQFDVSGGSNPTFGVETHHNSAVENFDFEFSTDGSNWTLMLTVTKTADNDAAQTFALPDSTSGTVLVRAVDTDRSRKESTLDTLFVDEIFIRTLGLPGPTLPEVTVSTTDSSAAELGQDAGELLVSRSGDLTGDLEVFYSVSGSASNGTDYLPLSGSVTIPAGNSSAPITITPNDDTDPEGNEDVILTLTPSLTYTIGSPSSDAVTIADDDSAGLNLIYIADISFDSKRGGKDWRAVFEIRSDSDGDGLGTANDDPAVGVAVTVTFAGQTYTGVTDSNGVFRTNWIKNLSSGDYYANAVDLALDGYTWSPFYLNLEDDSDGDDLPDDLLVV